MEATLNLAVEIIVLLALLTLLFWAIAYALKEED